MVNKSWSWSRLGIVAGCAVFLTAGFLLCRNPVEEEPTTLARSSEARSQNKPTEDAVEIRFDRLRVSYDEPATRDSALAEIVKKVRRAYFSGDFSKGDGWEEVSVKDTAEPESAVLRLAVSRIRVGQMSEVIDEGNAFHVLRVTSR